MSMEKTVRLATTKLGENIRNELFGPIQEASRKPYPFGLDPRNTWCVLSELRLNMLLLDFKPVGVNRSLNMLALIDRMNAISDDEDVCVKIFLNDKDTKVFEAQRRNLETGRRGGRHTFAPKYTLRPTMEVIKAKLDTYFNMEVCEKNESNPAGFADTAGEYELPEYLLKQIANGTLKEQPSGSSSSATETNRPSSAQKKSNPNPKNPKNQTPKNRE
ncbi:hypothetical protein L5515_013810 [Caenorhabditis briggsae]|uniref:Uncharacterized protein n=1 Tax=Caenorhabditis briggsae TaxID=6238 RepID=A0AAE9ECI5_CAEBR|nr:hypothetical protein L3Y34_017673 [Caenorhabditis briggsae]UMM17082.1 hypothetical protein L5515_013810 [Caenorhabditis briggsae]